MKNKNRFILLVGAPRGGKSFFLDKLLKEKKSYIFNCGTTGEFKHHKIVKLPSQKIFQQKTFPIFEPKKIKIIIQRLKMLTGNFVVDDAYPVFRNGVSAYWLSFFSRINHNAKGKGINTFLVFHNFEQINSCLLDYTTDIIIFKSETLNVNFRRDVGVKINAKIKKAVYLLNSAPKYSHVHIKID